VRHALKADRPGGPSYRDRSLRRMAAQWTIHRGSLDVCHESRAHPLFAPAPDNSLITTRSIGTDEIHALDWEAP
jgi:hypothetical protein